MCGISYSHHSPLIISNLSHVQFYISLVEQATLNSFGEISGFHAEIRNEYLLYSYF